jgi:adenylyltransferase/sulfurtransferase
MRLKRDPECPACGEAPSIDRLIDYEEFCGLKAGKGAGSERIEVSPADLNREMQANDILLLDVREPYELKFASFGVPHVHIPLCDLPARAEELPREREIVVACRSGSRSAHAARYLRDLGYTRVRNLEGGINAWSDQVDPSIPKY